LIRDEKKSSPGPRGPGEFFDSVMITAIGTATNLVASASACRAAYCILNARRKKTGFRRRKAGCVMGRTFVGALVG
jgi:hypothetical protein